MSTLDELVFYCRKENPIGALVLFGESGCGKTYLIDKELKEALQASHFIVRVSLFGINSIDALHSAVKKQWLYTVAPLLAKLSSQPSQMEKGRSFFKAVNSVLRTVNPQAGMFADAMMHSMDYIVVMPVAEDHLTKEKKRVVLVFDDVDRTRLNWTELLGSINEYCENQNFNTIIIANREHFNETNPETADIMRAAKEKTVAYSVLNCPDYERIVHEVIADRSWKTEEYAEFLKEHEQTILELFGSEPLDTEDGGAALGKHHNIRSLITALESFHRVYYHMTRAGVRDIDPYFCSFISFYLAEKSGISRNGKTSYTFTDKEIGRLYPCFSADSLFESIRHWIRFGYWDKKLFIEELSRISTVDMTEIMGDGEDELG